MRNRGARTVVGMAALTAVLVASCGGDDDEDAPSDAATTAIASADQPAASTPPPTTESPARPDISAAADASLPETTAAEAEPYAPQPLAEEATVTVAVSSKIESFLNIFLADAMGEFAKENISISLQIVPTSESTLLLTQGQVDVVPTSMSAGNFNLIAEGGEIRGVFSLHGEPEGSQQGFWMRTDAMGGDGFQPADLVGQRVLTPSGAGSFSVAFFYNDVLKAGGVQPNDISWERIGVPDAPVALTSGAAPAALLLTPFWQVAVDDACCEFIDGYPDNPVSFVAFGPNLLNDRPEVGEAFVRALARTVVTYLQGDYHNDPVVGPKSAEALEQPLDTFQSQPSLVWSPEFPLAVADFDEIQQFFFDTAVLSYTEPLTEEEIFDHQFIEALEG